ncbi:alpha-ketoglutarate-dependent dioxygenase alkB homolog 7, mitochondrial isoform X2 [Drosophila serrata]|uniref:alpha-ketoglutarate-dependent dioxygenase alkB homolog 7, mitochondrial isoform X2 n=1 Tax=Drosophila serrata TaxID=7274 RepID=UPI000A1D2FC9|nr:alpha-ketoglutarate-dependent dioxygenase alkB homolog 7, mitochondrial isoform X2 [Drosophila serrata]
MRGPSNRVCFTVLPDQQKRCSGSACWGFPWLMYPLAVPIEWLQSIEEYPTPLTQRNNMLLLGRRLPSTGILRRLSLLHFSGDWTPLEKQVFEADMRVIKDFVSEQEELGLVQEIEPHLRRLPYESSHWDDAIHGYRESERRDWTVANRSVLDRVSKTAFNGQVMPHVHILDLTEEGVIKPHVDSFCGHTIAGLSLLSDCVMRLAKVSSKDVAKDTEHRVADVLLPRRSLYIMSHVARYQFTHEVLDQEQSWFGNSRVVKRRRLSVICRNEP